MRPDKIKNEDLPKFTGIEVELSEDGEAVTLTMKAGRATAILEAESNNLLRMAGGMLASGETKDAKGVAHMGACYKEQARYVELHSMIRQRKAQVGE